MRAALKISVASIHLRALSMPGTSRSAGNAVRCLQQINQIRLPREGGPEGISPWKTQPLFPLACSGRLVKHCPLRQACPLPLSASWNKFVLAEGRRPRPAERPLASRGPNLQNVLPAAGRCHPGGSPEVEGRCNRRWTWSGCMVRGRQARAPLRIPAAICSAQPLPLGPQSTPDSRHAALAVSIMASPMRGTFGGLAGPAVTAQWKTRYSPFLALPVMAPSESVLAELVWQLETPSLCWGATSCGTGANRCASW